MYVVLPNKNPAVEVNAEAEQRLDVATVAVGVALQALQQNPAVIENHHQKSNCTQNKL